MSRPVTASMLYDLVQCPHRVARDLHCDHNERDEVSPFTRLLWERGHAFEKQTIADLEIPFLDLSDFGDDEREALTLKAIKDDEHLIYGGRIRAGDLLGEPDLLRKANAGYEAGDIKSGAGEESVGQDQSKPKKHYAVQLALYTAVLEQLGLSSGRRAFVWDIHGNEIVYNLMDRPGPRSAPLWDVYEETLGIARQIIAKELETLPALSSICKQCYWRTACRKEIDELDDLTLIAELGRAKRDSLLPHIASVRDLSVRDIAAMALKGGRTIVPGIGLATLEKAKRRAQLLVTEGATPYLTETFIPIASELEVFFDIEVDPFRDVCYLHGFLERRNRELDSERFVACFASEPTPEGEREAFAEAVGYLAQRNAAAIYYYSPYERTIWNKLRGKYPEVISQEEIDAIFAEGRSMDLYHDAVRSKSEWPTNDQSIKTIAKYLGFEWRDTDPSGAASIEWYDQWINSGDPAIKQRILDYNEDDCRATRVLLDGLSALQVVR